MTLKTSIQPRSIVFGSRKKERSVEISRDPDSFVKRIDKSRVKKDMEATNIGEEKPGVF